MSITIILGVGLVLAIAAVAVLLILRKKDSRVEQIGLIQQQLDGIREQVRNSLEGSSQTVNKQLADLSTQLQTQLHRHTGSLNDTRKSMDDRLDNAARVIGDVQKAMGKIHESLAPVGELRDILKAPKMRGGFGEVMLEQLLQEMLPSNMYFLQHALGKSERVDAAIKIGGQLVPIDSKFPLEKYHEYLKAPTDEEKKQAKKGLTSAVKKHADDVAKYIKPDEGTYPFAMMYIPSESIFYELFITADNGETLWAHLANRRVFPVSSNTLYIYLQTISFGLKGMQIAEHATEVLNRLEQLQKNMVDIKKNYEVLGKHLKNAQSAYDDTDKRLDKLDNKLSTISVEVVPALAEPSKEEDIPLVQ